MYRIILIFVLFLLGCTSRVVYEERTVGTSGPAAININTATVEELDKLPHIGRKTAEAIVRFRNENGPFRRPEYLMQIRGMSGKRFAELRDLIRTE
jgi:competence protein ComEA